MDYETISEYKTYVNNDALKVFGITLPEDISKVATDVISA